MLPTSSGLVCGSETRRWRGKRRERKREESYRQETRTKDWESKREEEEGAAEIASLERDDATSGGRICVYVCIDSRMHTRTGLILWRNYSERKIIQSRGTQVTVAGIRAPILEYIGRICGFETLIEERIGFYFRLSISTRILIITWKIKAAPHQENWFCHRVASLFYCILLLVYTKQE